MKKLVPLLMVALAAVTLGAVYLWQELRDVRLQSGEVQSHITDLQLQTARQAASPPAQSTSTGMQTAAVTAPAGTAPTLPAAAPAEKKAGSGLQDLARQMLGSPEGQEMLKAQVRMILPTQYPDLGKELGLTPAETDKLFDLLAKQQMAMTTGGLDILGGGATDRAAMQETQRKIQEQQRATQAEVTAMLGDKMPRFEEYQKTLPMRQQVNQLQSALGTGNNALSDSQTRPLINALSAEQTRIQQERRNAPRPQQQGPANQQAAIEQQLELAAEDNRRMVSVASSHLNPQQLESYRRQLDQQLNLQSTLIRGISSQMGNQGGGQPAAGKP